MSLAILFSILFVTLSFAANPITTPIIQSGVKVFVRRFAQIPAVDGRGNRINAIVSRGFNLYACTDTGAQVFEVNRRGNVSLYFDLREAVETATDREVDFSNFLHGGLRGLAFHPFYFKNGLFYTSYMETRPSNPENFEYLSDVDDPIVADSVLVEWRYDFARKRVDPMSYRQVLRIGMAVYDHPIKQIAFRGLFLYISHGDGTTQSASGGGGQQNDALGKILRINPLKYGHLPYTVPRSNPFVRSSKFLSEIYALGFRNPHHICFSYRGDLIAAETGRDNVEEINIVVRGGNYGWSEREGTFVHRTEGGGIINGIEELPEDDARFGFRYPVAQVGHVGEVGDGFVGQAIAGGCPVENRSPLHGLYFYSNFPRSGDLYFSKLKDMRTAVVTGKPSKLTQARTFRAKILFDDDDDPSTPPVLFENLGDVVRSEPGRANALRVDIRFGRGRYGELYWSSKTTGIVYLITNSLPYFRPRHRHTSHLRFSNLARDAEE